VPFPGQVIAGPYHQVLGEGCVYPAAVQTLGNQLSAAGRSWSAYLQDMGNDPARDNTADTARGPGCGHPATWAIDHTQKAAKGDQYAARHDGFAFFRSVTGRQAYCDAHILSFLPLPGDLTGSAPPGVLLDLAEPVRRRPRRTLRHRRPGGLAQADGGLIVIIFDEGSDSAACCGEASGFRPDHPNVPLPGKNGSGGGRIGAVLLSP
jgi:phosphatidylinositol-3-phosphatase